MGGFIKEVSHALGDLDLRFEPFKHANVCRRRFSTLPAPLDVIAVEGNAPTCAALASEIGANLHRAAPHEMREGVVPEPNVTVWTRVRDAEGQLHAASARTTLVCAAAGERNGIAQWRRPARGDSAGQEYGVGLATANTGHAGGTVSVDVPVLTVDAVYERFGGIVSARPYSDRPPTAPARRPAVHPWCAALEDAAEPLGINRTRAPLPLADDGEYELRAWTRRVFLLKVDAEGADAAVLRGASGLLRRRLVDHLVFEYNTPWVHFGVELRPVLRALEAAGYTCGLLGVGGVIPLSGGWWLGAWARPQTRMFSNVWCAAERSDFVTASLAYNANGPFARTLGARLLEYGLALRGGDANA